MIDKIGPDVKCRCSDSGLLLPCANLTFWRNGSLVQARNAMLPTISSKVDASLTILIQICSLINILRKNAIIYLCADFVVCFLSLPMKSCGKFYMHVYKKKNAVFCLRVGHIVCTVFSLI